MSTIQKLELTWVGKNQDLKLEPRILIENKDLSNNGENSDNMIIHGDNLLALKALEKTHAGMVKCIYIDPPYNTGTAFEHYDDNQEHSIWLNLMKERLKLLKKLLSEDGSIFIQIDYNEQAYLKVLCDEIFGRLNYMTMITCKVKAPSGIASGANPFFDCSEYILFYAKNKKEFSFNQVKVDNFKIGPSAPTVTNVYNQLIEKLDYKSFVDYDNFEDDVDIKVLTEEFFSISTIKKSERSELNYYNNYKDIFRIAAISGGRDKKILNYLQTKPDYDKNKIYSYSYVASQGKNKGKKITNYIYKNSNILFLKDFIRVDEANKVIYKQDIVTNMLYNDWWQGLTNEGLITFKNGQKPEKLIKLLFSITTKEGDLVLDSFLGSGSTAATAHKMNRKYIGIEMGEHAYSHCKYRIDNIISNQDNTGISKEVNWQGGGGYKFYELAPTLVNIDDFGQEVINPSYNPDQLAAAVALHEGYKYNPNPETFWKQSTNGEISYLYVTTNHITLDYYTKISNELKEDEYLIIACKSFDAELTKRQKNIHIKKIPNSLLKNCEFDKENYNLNIVNPPIYDEEDECDE